MVEYIEREALMKELSESTEPFNTGSVFRAIRKQPAADVAPVVRCKDCTYYDLGVCLKIYSDGNAQKDSWQSRNPDDFCSYGERRGNNPGLFTMEAK